MKGFTQQNSTDEVENWTLQQCNDYLLKYPKGLKADRVHARKMLLSPPDTHSKKQPMSPIEEKPSSKQTDKPETTSQAKPISTATTSTDANLNSDCESVTSKQNHPLLVFAKVIATIVLLVPIGLALYGLISKQYGYMAVLPLMYWPVTWIEKMWGGNDK